MKPLLFLGGIALLWLFKLGSTMSSPDPWTPASDYRIYNGRCTHIDQILSDWIDQNPTSRAWLPEEVAGLRRNLLSSLPRCTP